MDYQSAYNQLGAAYDPQTSLVNSQIAALPGQQAAQQSGLDQAKVNAFRDITNSANAKGVVFSGVPIDQQAQYVGTKYLPAVANLNTSFNNTKNTLLGQLNDLNSRRVTQAQNTVSAYQKAQQEAAYQNAQLQLGYARLNKPSGGGGLTAYQQLELQRQAQQDQLNAGKGYGLTQKSNNAGYALTGPNGQPVSLYNYASATNTPLLDLLRQSNSQYDKNAYNDAQVWLKQKDENFALQKLQQHYGALF